MNHNIYHSATYEKGAGNYYLVQSDTTEPFEVSQNETVGQMLVDLTIAAASGNALVAGAGANTMTNTVAANSTEPYSMALNGVAAAMYYGDIRQQRNKSTFGTY